MDGEPDYIVVGGGSAGAVIAARLSEDPSCKVLLLEAGGNGRGFLVQLPAGMAKLFGNKRYDWAYPVDSDASIGGRPYNLPAGRMLGGGSSINGQVHIRGTRGDFDNWARLGATGWDYDGVLPYFLKAESFKGPPSQDRGAFGPVAISPMKRPPPLAKTFLDSCAQSGIPTLPDYADGMMDGAYLTVCSQENGLRCSTEKAYLRPAKKRDNLKIMINSPVERVVFEGRRAVGVELAAANGVQEVIRAKREVIISAGAIGSAGILLRSGIGDPNDLATAEVDVVRALPEVGRNLRDHVGCPVSKLVNQPTYNTQTGPLDMLKHLYHFAFTRSGLLANPSSHALGLARTRPDLAEPDVQLSLACFAVNIDQAGSVAMAPEAAVGIYANVCRPFNSGSVRISRSDPSGLRVKLEMLGDQRDVETLIGAMKLIERLFKADAWKGIVIGDRLPKVVPTDDAQWEQHVRATAQSFYHMAGTCRMGSDPAAVVTPDLRVNGVENLRVADASIMPALISANTNAACIMIGEKAADIISHAGK